ncbi:PKD domain-containing protein [Nucisporomicrobium flavum]|jgi:5'-nucleotidase|uniref:PKD domain-containing protein n=1 Tax=Nucisporomicrobium flavum TaxID=2785915 RepID=UPI0018F6226A|nr:PKD domain-containing protein [Nucisporomicrobium flavum]
MNTGGPRGLAAMLTLALGAGTVAGAGVLGTPAWAAEGSITASYAVDKASIWTGQQVTLTRTAFEDSTPDTAPTFALNWGDGTTPEPPAASLTSASHTFTKAGSWTVVVSITDDGVQTDVSNTVTVAAGGGSFKFDPTWNWTWYNGGHEATLKLSGIPSSTSKVWVNWGDGETSLVNKANTSVKHYYSWGSTGKHTAKVTLETASGSKVAASAGTYTLVEDTYNPSATLKVPSSPSKASSWKTVQGTAKDSQIGIEDVGIQLWKWTSTKDYYYNFQTAKWVKYTPGVTNIPNAAVKWVGVNSSGVWKTSVAGLSKGYYLEVDYVAYDKAGNNSGWKYKVQKLTS